MKEPTYRDAISHAWDLTKKHKLLWLFGFFAAFLGQMGLMDLVVQLSLAEKNFAWYPLYLNLKDQGLFVLRSFSDSGLSTSDTLWFVWLLIFFIALGVLLTFVAVTSQGALIHGIHQSLSILKGKKVNVSKAWHKGTGHFWRLFFLAALKKIILGALTLCVGLALFNAIEAGKTNSDSIIFFFLFILVAFAGVLVSLLTIYAAAYVVIEEYSFTEALHEAWYLVRDHWLVSLEIAGIILLLNIAIACLIAALGFFFLVEMAILWALSVALQSALLWGVLTFVGSLLLIMAVIFIGSLLTVFTTSVWTYLFVVMHKKGIKSRVLHLFQK